jgi:hypothetical protein
MACRPSQRCANHLTRVARQSAVVVNDSIRTRFQTDSMGPTSGWLSTAKWPAPTGHSDLQCVLPARMNGRFNLTTA